MFPSFSLKRVGFHGEDRMLRHAHAVRLKPFALSLSKGERTAREKGSTVIIDKAF
jgi:hypothetical protein